jgi:GTPase SAR1 family protein
MKQIDWSDDTVVRIQLWDIAGQVRISHQNTLIKKERFSSMTRIYYREAVAACIVFDVTTPKSFDAVKNWKKDLDAKVQLPDGKPLPVMLLANKCDMPYHAIDLETFTKDNGYIGWFVNFLNYSLIYQRAATSAKMGQGIDGAMDVILKNIMEAAVKLGMNHKIFLTNKEFQICLHHPLEKAAQTTTLPILSILLILWPNQRKKSVLVEIVYLFIVVQMYVNKM